MLNSTSPPWITIESSFRWLLGHWMGKKEWLLEPKSTNRKARIKISRKEYVDLDRDSKTYSLKVRVLTQIQLIDKSLHKSKTKRKSVLCKLREEFNKWRTKWTRLFAKDEWWNVLYYQYDSLYQNTIGTNYNKEINIVK
jgi:hypothetical protein